jgi:predicted phosphodiesterase
MSNTKPWSNAEHQIVFDGYKQDKTYKEIQDLLNQNGFDRSAEAIRKFIARNTQEQPQASAYGVQDTYLSDKLADKYHKSVEELMSFRDSLFKTTTEKFMKIGNPVDPTWKILTISDMHLPFVNKHVIEHALENHSDARTLVINGDIFDGYLVSKWPKDKQILLQWEYRIAVKWIEFFAGIFPNVVLVAGNHDQRSLKYFSSHVDPMVNFLTSPDMLGRLSRGYDFDEDGNFEKIHNFSNVHYDGGLTNWYTLLGKTLFVHPLKGFSTQLGKTSDKFAKHFLDREDFQCMVMAHTHQQFRGFRKQRLLLEQGCCCIPMEYEVAGHGMYDSQVFGYATVEMDNEGNVDFDRSRTHYVGTGSPVKTDDPLRFV